MKYEISKESVKELLEKHEINLDDVSKVEWDTVTRTLQLYSSIKHMNIELKI